MVKLAGVFGSMAPFRALVIGDFLLDAYTTGRVKRISPEAPVPVLEVTGLSSRPGGAGNVALNLAALGAQVSVCGRVGLDPEGKELIDRLAHDSIRTEGLFVEQNYRTSVKNRLIADSQQLLRIDIETVVPVASQYEEKAIAYLAEAIASVDVVAISDYGKGFLTAKILSSAIALASQHNVPLVVDPKGTDFAKYRGALLIKPNLSEAYAAAKVSSSTSLEEMARNLLAQTEVQYLLITRSEAGISLFERGGLRQDFPVRSREVKDVTGAGDTVLAMICLGFANRLEMERMIPLANIAAGISIEQVGCAQVTLSQIARRMLEVDSESKIFDQNDLYALKQVLMGCPYSLLVLEKTQLFTQSLFKTIRGLVALGRELLVYVDSLEPADELIALLTSLSEVKFILLQTQNLQELCRLAPPTEVFAMDGEKIRTGSVQLLRELLNYNEMIQSEHV